MKSVVEMVSKGALLALAAAGALLTAPSAHAQPFDSAASVPPALFHGGAVADFDGDQHADWAFTESGARSGRAGAYRVHVHLAGQPATAFDVVSSASGGLHIAALDVDGDRDLDLVITTEHGREPVGVWINDGRGAFSKGEPDAYPRFIWRSPSHFWERPDRAGSDDLLALAPAADEEFSLESAGPALCRIEAPLPVCVLGGRIPFLLIHRSGPFRAPPRS